MELTLKNLVLNGTETYILGCKGQTYFIGDYNTDLRLINNFVTAVVLNYHRYVDNSIRDATLYTSEDSISYRWDFTHQQLIQI